MFTLWMTGLFLLLTTLGATAQNSGTTGPLNWSYDSGTKTLAITGTGAMPDFNNASEIPWHSLQSKIQTVTIGDGVTSVGNNAFSDCALTSVTLPNSLTAIGDHAFKGCSGLTSITIPNSVTTIGEWAFKGCSGLTSITLPNSLTAIGQSALSGCTGLTSITIPNSVTTIGEWAFFGCSGLTSITFPNSLTAIGESAFYGCGALTSITLPDALTTIGESAFKGCSGLKSITFPNSLTTIGESAFYDCGALTSITLPDALTTIGRSAFYGCSGLKSITFPNSLTTIGESAFYNCGSLTSITIPNSVTTIGRSAFYGCSGLKSITLPDGLTTIEERAFYNCGVLTSITIPNSVATIGESAFYGCSGLKSITLPDGLTTIEERAFYNCGVLTSITIPNSVATIGESAFYGCGALKDVTVAWDTPIDIQRDVFRELTLSGIRLHVPAGKKTVYEAKDVWKEFNIVEDDDFGGLQWNYDAATKTLTITNPTPDTPKPMPNFATPNDQLWGAFQKEIQKITIGDGVTSVGDFAFSGCDALKSITLPKSVTTIGQSAFSGCWDLRSLTLPDGVNTIGEKAFYDCLELTSITIPKSVTAIGQETFHYCVSLTSLTLPDALTAIGKKAFYSCNALTSVTFPKSITTIGENAFDGCTALKDLTVAWKDNASIPDIGSKDVFKYLTPQNIKLHVPAGKKAVYEAKDVWKEFQIVELPLIPALSVTPKTLSFVDAGGTKPITVNANGAWTARCDASWLTLSALSGTDDGTITVTAPIYEDEQPRTAKIIFTSNALKETVTVTQNPKPGPAFVALDYTELTLPAGASQRLVVTAYPKDADINRDVKWYSSNNDIASVSRDGTVTALAPGRADITVVANVGGQQTACRVRVVPAEQMVSVTSGSDNTLRLALVAPSDADFTLSFDVDLPEGFALDAKKTAPDPSLAASYTLTITGKRVEMKPNGLRSGGTMEKRNLLTFACTAAPGTSKGSYKAALRNFTFTPTAGYALQNITVPFTFTHTVANQTIDGLRVYAAGGALHLTLPKAETVHIYNVVGSLVRTMNASAGDHVLPLSSGVYVVRVGERVTKILIK